MRPKKKTYELIKDLKYKKVEEVLRDVPDYDSQYGYGLELLNKQLDKRPDLNYSIIARQLGITKSSVRMIFLGERHANRDNLIGILYTLGTELEEINIILKRMGHAELSPNNGKRDTVIISGILNQKSFDDIDDKLRKLKMKGLWKEESEK